MNAEFESIFARLRQILETHAKRLDVTADAADHYCLSVAYSEKLKKGYPAAWVKIEKNYVSFHFMPIYMFPQVRKGLSKKLRARMQGKSCFNFKTQDESLFEELEKMVAQGFDASRAGGFGP
jgi:hypothetical protein